MHSYGQLAVYRLYANSVCDKNNILVEIIVGTTSDIDNLYSKFPLCSQNLHTDDVCT